MERLVDIPEAQVLFLLCRMVIVRGAYPNYAIACVTTATATSVTASASAANKEQNRYPHRLGPRTPRLLDFSHLGRVFWLAVARKQTDDQIWRRNQIAQMVTQGRCRNQRLLYPLARRCGHVSVSEQPGVHRRLHTQMPALHLGQQRRRGVVELAVVPQLGVPRKDGVIEVPDIFSWMNKIINHLTIIPIRAVDVVVKFIQYFEIEHLLPMAITRQGRLDKNLLEPRKDAQPGLTTARHESTAHDVPILVVIFSFILDKLVLLVHDVEDLDMIFIGNVVERVQ